MSRKRKTTEVARTGKGLASRIKFVDSLSKAPRRMESFDYFLGVILKPWRESVGDETAIPTDKQAWRLAIALYQATISNDRSEGRAVFSGLNSSMTSLLLRAIERDRRLKLDVNIDPHFCKLVKLIWPGGGHPTSSEYYNNARLKNYVAAKAKYQTLGLVNRFNHRAFIQWWTDLATTEFGTQPVNVHDSKNLTRLARRYRSH